MIGESADAWRRRQVWWHVGFAALRTPPAAVITAYARGILPPPNS